MKKIDPQTVFMKKPHRSSLKDKYKSVPEEYKKIAESMEQTFAKDMLQQMEKSVQRSKPLSTAEKYYQSLLTNERAKILAESQNNLGIKEMVLDDIYFKHQRPAPARDIKIYQGHEASKEK